MASDAGLPTAGQLVDKVPLIKNPGFWVPKPVELPPDIHPLPDDVHAYFVYPHTLEEHVLSTLPSALEALQQSHSQRLHLLASYAESKERARKARLKEVAPGYAEGGAALEPTRRKETLAPAATASPAIAINPPSQQNTLLGSGSGSGGGAAAGEAPAPAGSFLGGDEFGSPKEMGEATLDRMQRDQMLQFVEGLEKLDTTLGGSGGGGKAGHVEVDDLI
ncbi:hypothetical protein JCM10207_000828 [Rhodosporidiobolus poonsookiae]